MNAINLSAIATSKQKQNKKKKKSNKVTYGLNRRGGGGGGKKSAFDDDDSSSSSDGDDEARGGGGSNNNERDEVNRNLVLEQAALRKRAEQASEVYDYDGLYEKEQEEKQRQADEERTNTTTTTENKKKSSRYIGDLLKAAKVRKNERDIIYERKIAKEQEIEDKANNGEFMGKEKFITSAYKQKLAEREEFTKNENKKQEQDDGKNKNAAGDKSSSFAANFYGNLNRNISMGGGSGGGGGASSSSTKNNDTPNQNNDPKDKSFENGNSHDDSRGLNFLEGFEKPKQEEGDEDNKQASSNNNNVPSCPTTIAQKRVKDDNDSDDDLTEERILELQRKSREERVKKARIRYFQRHPEIKIQ